MIEPYTALCIQNTNFCVRTQEDIQKNLDLICEVIDHSHYTKIEYPVRLMTIPEAGIQSFVDSQMDWEHKEAAKALFNTTVPGPETEVLSSESQRVWNLHLRSIEGSGTRNQRRALLQHWVCH